MVEVAAPAPTQFSRCMGHLLYARPIGQHLDPFATFTIRANKPHPTHLGLLPRGVIPPILAPSFASTILDGNKPDTSEQIETYRVSYSKQKTAVPVGTTALDCITPEQSEESQGFRF